MVSEENVYFLFIFMPCKPAPTHLSLFEAHNASIVFATGRGLRPIMRAAPPPKPGTFFEPRKLASSRIVETHYASIVCLQMRGGGLRLPPTPTVFFSRASLKHVSVSGSYHASILFLQMGGGLPPNP